MKTTALLLMTVFVGGSPGRVYPRMVVRAGRAPDAEEIIGSR